MVGMHARRIPLQIGILMFVALAGCAEVDEVWQVRPDGGGRYKLSVRYNGDLLRRIRDVVGEARIRELSPRPLPLDVSVWRRTLAQVKGLKVIHCEERTTDGGMRELSLDVEFDSIRSMVAWEFLSCRTTTVTNANRDDGETVQTFTMNPLARVPVLRKGLSWWRLTTPKATGKRTMRNKTRHPCRVPRVRVVLPARPYDSPRLRPRCCAR